MHYEKRPESRGVTLWYQSSGSEKPEPTGNRSSVLSCVILVCLFVVCDREVVLRGATDICFWMTYNLYLALLWFESLTACYRNIMPPRRNPEANLQASMAQMAQAMAGMTQFMTQQAQVNAAQAAENVQRHAVDEAREVQRQQREEAAAQYKGLSDFRRHDPPRFLGEADPEKEDLWIQGVEKIFTVLHTPDEAKLDYVVYLLLGDAEYWWRGARLILESKQEVVNWGSFRRVFLEKYFPVSAQEAKEKQFMKLHQGAMTIDEYAAKLESLAKHFRFFKDHMDETYLCSRFMDGLRYEIEESVRPLGVKKFQPVVEKSREIEAMKNKRNIRPVSGGPVRTGNTSQGNTYKDKKHQKKPYQRPSGKNYGSLPQSSTATPGGQGQKKEITCFKCNRVGHYSRDCKGTERVCFNCNKPGHFARECKEPKAEPVVNMAQGNRPAARARVYTMNGQEAATAEGLIHGQGEVAGNLLSIVFDSGATPSFISTGCVDPLATPADRCLIANTACLHCPVMIDGKTYYANLLCLPLKDLDVILGMDWLSR